MTTAVGDVVNMISGSLLMTSPLPPELLFWPVPLRQAAL